MPISMIHCPTCGHDNHFFSMPKGLGLKGTCGHIIKNYAETKKANLWETAKTAENRKRRKK